MRFYSTVTRQYQSYHLNFYRKLINSTISLESVINRFERLNNRIHRPIHISANKFKNSSLLLSQTQQTHRHASSSKKRSTKLKALKSTAYNGDSCTSDQLFHIAHDNEPQLTHLNPTWGDTVNNDMKYDMFRSENHSLWLVNKNRNLRIIKYLKDKYHKLQPTIPLENEEINLTIRRLQSRLKETFKRKTPIVHPFGSVVTKLGLPSGDLDLTIELPPQNSNHQLSSIQKLSPIVKSIASPVSIQVIPHARVPIIKYIDAETGIKVDVNVGHMLGVYNSKLIKAYLGLDPRLRPFVMLLKAFAAQNRINDPAAGTLSSYALTIMAIAYFQEYGYLPSLQLAYPSSDPRKIVIVPETYPNVKRRQIKSHKNKVRLRQVDVSYLTENTYVYSALRNRPSQIWKGSEGVLMLFWGLIRHFASNDAYTSEHALSIKHGTMRYKIEKNESNVKYHNLVILDPFETGRNVASSAQWNLEEIQNVFYRASNVLNANAPLSVVKKVLFPLDK